MTVLLGNTENMPDKIAWMAAALSDLEARGERGGKLDVYSGRKADYIPEATVAPDPKRYGYDPSTRPTALNRRRRARLRADRGINQNLH